MDALAALPLLIYLNRNRKLPIGILGVLNLAAACYSLFAAGNPGTAWSHDAPLRFIMEAPLNLLRYLDLMFLPGGYSIFHAYPEAGFLRISASAGSAALIIFAAWRIRKKLPPAAAGTAWLILMLLPSLLIPNPDPVNESRAYAAFAGAALLAASLLAAAGNSAGRLLSTLVSRAGSYRNSTLTGAAAVLVSFACLPPLALITIERNHAWNSDILIWQEAVSMNPGVHLPVYNLGVALIRNGEIEKGCESLLEAIKLNPRDDMSYSAAGYCYELMGERDLARAYYSRALEINPENNTARDLIGTPGRIETKK